MAGKQLRVATVWHCLASERLCLAGTGAGAALVLAAPLPHIPGRQEGNSSAPRGRVPAFVCHFGEMRLNVSLPLQSLPCQLQPLKRQRQAVFCVGPASCALQVAEASALWQLLLGQRRGFCRAQWVSSDASSRYNTTRRDITALDAFWAGCGREAACTLQPEAVVSNPTAGGLTVGVLAVLQVARNRLGMFSLLSSHSLHCASGEVPVL